jgi:hypothetical protein
MNSLREAAQQALEVLEKTHTQPGCDQWQAERKASVALRAALAQQEQDKKLVDLEAVNRELLETLKLALSAHGVMLLSDPPQEAWKTYGVEQKARAAIAKAEGEQT